MPTGRTKPPTGIKPARFPGTAPAPAPPPDFDAPLRPASSGSGPDDRQFEPMYKLGKSQDPNVRCLRARFRALVGKTVYLHLRNAPGAYKKIDEYFAKVAAELEAHRKRSYVTQRELASRSGIHQAEVSRILSGRTQPRVGTAEKLARALGAELRVVSTSGRVRRPSNKKKKAR